MSGRTDAMVTLRDVLMVLVAQRKCPPTAREVAGSLRITVATTTTALRDLQWWGLVIGVPSSDGLRWEVRPEAATAEAVAALPTWADRVVERKPRLRRPPMSLKGTSS